VALIPTTTEITEMDGIAVKGETFRVRGRVVDRYGSGVSGAYVTVHLKIDKAEDAPVVGSGWTENGWFDITCEVSRDIEVGDYHAVARSWGTATHDGSRSNSKIRIVAETAILLSAPGRVMVGMEFLVSGRLVEKATGAGVGLQGVEVRCGASVQRKRTDNDGSFAARFSLPTPDNHVLSAFFAGSDYYLSSSSDRTVEVVRPYILPLTGDRLARGERAAISGTVPVGGLVVRVSLDDRSVETTSGDGGSFSAEIQIPALRPLGATAVTYTLPAVPFSVSQQVAVCARTFVGLSAPATAEPREELIITASLKDDLGTPVQDAWLTLRHAGGSLRANTDASGTAVFRFTAPSEPGQLGFTVSFEGTGPYLSSENAGTVALAAPPAVLPLASIALLAAVIPTVTAVALLLRRRKKPKAEPAKDARKLAAREELSLKIEFPQVKGPFPDVWGVGEPMRVSVRLERGGKPVGETALRVAIDGKWEEVRTSASGEWSTECKFDRGTHGITTEYAKGKTKLRAEREVRVVDYKEEVVGIFNSVLGSFREQGIDTEGDFAPREVQREAEKKVEGVDKKALDELVSVFEVANYSTHEVGRKEYERAYISSRSVLGPGGGPT
jgi:hypothetical protein